MLSSEFDFPLLKICIANTKIKYDGKAPSWILKITHNFHFIADVIIKFDVYYSVWIYIASCHCEFLIDNTFHYIAALIAKFFWSLSIFLSLYIYIICSRLGYTSALPKSNITPGLHYICLPFYNLFSDFQSVICLFCSATLREHITVSD